MKKKEKMAFSFYLSPGLVKKLVDEAKRDGRSMSSMLTVILKGHFG